MKYNFAKDKAKVEILQRRSLESAIILRKIWSAGKEITEKKMTVDGDKPPVLRVLVKAYSALLMSLADEALTTLENNGYITVNKDKDRADAVGMLAAKPMFIDATTFAIDEITKEAKRAEAEEK